MRQVSRKKSNARRTFLIIPANARAVYAPRENPNKQILSPALSSRQKLVPLEMKVWRDLLRTVVHDELVRLCTGTCEKACESQQLKPLHTFHMVAQVPGYSLIRPFGELVQPWTRSSICWWSIRSYTSLLWRGYQLFGWKLVVTMI